jgi:TolA-binding protein
MEGQKRNRNGSLKVVSQRDPWYDPENDILLPEEDKELFGMIGEVMKGKFDIEDAGNDPCFAETDRMAADIVSEYNKKEKMNRELEKFINAGVSFQNDPGKIGEEIKDINKEIKEIELDTIAADLVGKWNDQKQKNIKDPVKKEISDFVKGAADRLTNAVPESEGSNVKRAGRSIYIKYISLAAAVVAGAIFILKILLPSADPEKLFTEYYQPLSAVQSVTRGAGNDAASAAFSSALESYRNGRYEEAFLGFSDITAKDTSFLPARFFAGLTDIALGKYDQASQLLKEVAGRGSEYTKETFWYLGLTLLRTGDKESAAGYFSKLSGSPGYYSDRSGEILRRLK